MYTSFLYIYHCFCSVLLYIELNELYCSVLILVKFTQSGLFGSEVGLGSCLVKYGGLLNEQQVLLLLQPWSSQRGSSSYNFTDAVPELTPDSQK